ncbi:uncharacterized protein PG998_014310 [Apiospora kogelbergensis]|uniref:uncharacterized protein n=1 Tax=Apiospora kogelbergensis TaxID=1337665 RepID=UPI00312E2944
MPYCDREDSPETAALLENYNRRRVLKATYEEKKDRFAKEAEALQEEKDRIAQELHMVDTKYKALQAELAQLSAGYEADKTGLSHSLRHMVSGIMPTQLVAVQRGRGGCAKTYKQSAWCNTYWSHQQTPASLLFHSRDDQPDSPFARLVYEEYKGGCERVIIPAWSRDRYKRCST